MSGANNVVTVSLVANFGLKAASETFITLMGLPLHKYSIDNKVPLLPPSLATLEHPVSCTWSGSIAICDSIGYGVQTDDSNIVLSAMM